MYKIISLIFISCLMLGCSNPITTYVKSKPTVIVVKPKEQLLKDPCKAVPPGESLIELAINYNKNVQCIKEYQLQMDSIRKDIKKKENDHASRSQ